jgi:chorismate mutase
MDERLEYERSQIDAADALLVQALAARWRAVVMIGARKRELEMAGYDPERERSLRERWMTLAEREGLPRALVQAVFDAVIEACRAEVMREHSR